MLCEDKSMGREFWQVINKVFLDSKAKLYSSNGISKMSAKLDDIPLNKNDTLFCIFDNVGSKACYKVINKMSSDSKKKGYSYITSNYYCIEEVFLSFTFLSEWLNVRDEEIFNICKDIYNYIYNRHLLTDSHSYLYHPKLKSMYPNANTTEQMAAYFLTDVSKQYRRGFHLSKGTLGACWVCDCQKFNGYPKYCEANDCHLYCCGDERFLLPQGKLKFLWENSVLAISKNTIDELRSLC